MLKGILQQNCGQRWSAVFHENVRTSKVSTCREPRTSKLSTKGVYVQKVSTTCHGMWAGGIIDFLSWNSKLNSLPEHDLTIFCRWTKLCVAYVTTDEITFHCTVDLQVDWRQLTFKTVRLELACLFFIGTPQAQSVLLLNRTLPAIRT